MSTAWIILVFAGLLEIVWALCIKYSDGCRHLGWTAAGLTLAVVSIVILAQAMRHLPASTAYAVWAGVGAAGTAIVGIVFLAESASLMKIVSLVFIIFGIVGLRLEEGFGAQAEPSDAASVATK